MIIESSALLFLLFFCIFYSPFRSIPCPHDFVLFQKPLIHSVPPTFVFSLSLFIYSLLGAALLAGLCSVVLSTPDPQFLVLYQTVFCLTLRQLHIEELRVRHRFESVELLAVYSDWQVTLIGHSYLNKPCHFFLSFHHSSRPLLLSLI